MLVGVVLLPLLLEHQCEVIEYHVEVSFLRHFVKADPHPRMKVIEGDLLEEIQLSLHHIRHYQCQKPNTPLKGNI